jgi:hypothetical protein
MAQIPRGTRLQIEPLQMIRTSAHSRGQRLYGDHAVNEWITRLIDGAHGALANLTYNFEFSQCLHSSQVKQAYVHQK